MKLLPFDKHNNDPKKYEDWNYTTNRDRHITQVLEYLQNRVEGLITESNAKDDLINSLGYQVDHLTAQMDYMAKVIGKVAEAKDFESLDAISRWLKKRDSDGSTKTTTTYKPKSK